MQGSSFRKGWIKVDIASTVRGKGEARDPPVEGGSQGFVSHAERATTNLKTSPARSAEDQLKSSPPGRVAFPGLLCMRPHIHAHNTSRTAAVKGRRLARGMSGRGIVRSHGRLWDGANGHWSRTNHSGPCHPPGSPDTPLGLAIESDRGGAVRSRGRSPTLHTVADWWVRGGKWGPRGDSP